MNGINSLVDIIVHLQSPIFNMRMMSILNTHLSTALLNVVDTTEENIHLLEHDVSCFWDNEDNEQREEYVYTGEEEECVASFN
jgi:hypothetical protein